MSKIFIVEDDENIRELILYALGGSGFESLGFEQSTELFEELNKSNFPDLILLDIMLPLEDGLSVLKKLRDNKLYSEIPVIMLTAKGSEYDKVKGLDMGADDYVTKPFGVMELMSRINAVLRRTGNSKPDNKLTYGNITLDNERHTVRVADNSVNLTYKEYELLYFLLINSEIVLSRDKIMEVVWGFDFECESRTVDMHIKTLRQKLGDSGEYIKTVRGVGYCLRKA